MDSSFFADVIEIGADVDIFGRRRRQCRRRRRRRRQQHIIMPMMTNQGTAKLFWGELGTLKRLNRWKKVTADK